MLSIPSGTIFSLEAIIQIDFFRAHLLMVLLLRKAKSMRTTKKDWKVTFDASFAKKT